MTPLKRKTPADDSAMPDHVTVPFVEGIDGRWHVRSDDFWDNDISADVRAHAVCGGVWSCHVSSFPPVLMDRRAPHCRTCFPIGRKRRTA